jgi:predicted secreted hydrolase
MWRSRLYLLLFVLSGVACTDRPASSALDIGELLGSSAADGFARARQVRAFEFPRDHGSHPAYRNEWWYLTGNVRDADGRRFGYQVTFFRNAMLPPGPEPQGGSAWRTRTLWMVHAALTDVQGGQHYADERFSRGEPGLAGARSEPFAVWLENWRLEGSAAQGSAPAGSHAQPWSLSVHNATFALQLSLSGAREPVLQGDRGLSRKSAAPGNASYYYSFPRLHTEGELSVDGRRYTVSGLSWFDREWSTSVLDQDQTGWDWFALQFDSGEALMYYQLRRAGNEQDPHSRGSWVGADGGVQAILPQQIELRELAHWQAPDGRRYPVAWSLRWRPGGRHWRVEAVLDEQFMELSFRYWEGAVDVTEADSGQRVGQGYLEMTRSDTPAVR